MSTTNFYIKKAGVFTRLFLFIISILIYDTFEISAQTQIAPIGKIDANIIPGGMVAEYYNDSKEITEERQYLNDKYLTGRIINSYNEVYDFSKLNYNITSDQIEYFQGYLVIVPAIIVKEVELIDSMDTVKIINLGKFSQKYNSLAVFRYSKDHLEVFSIYKVEENSNVSNKALNINVNYKHEAIESLLIKYRGESYVMNDRYKSFVKALNFIDRKPDHRSAYDHNLSWINHFLNSL